MSLSFGRKNKSVPIFCGGQAGFTLIELVITIIILGALSLILIPFYQAITSSPDPVLRQRGIALGQAMMDEILSKKWDHNTPQGGGPICTEESDDPAVRSSLIDDDDDGVCDFTATPVGGLGPDLAETRTSYNDVDDYHGLDENAGTFIDQNGDSFSMPGYTRAVEVRYIDSNQPGGIGHDTAAATATTDSKLIVVTVTTPRNETLHFVSVVCNL